MIKRDHKQINFNFGLDYLADKTINDSVCYELRLSAKKHTASVILDSDFDNLHDIIYEMLDICYEK